MSLQVSIIIVTYNSSESIYNCLNTIYDNLDNISFEVIVVDNCSTDTTVSIVKGFDKATIIENSLNEGFATANNIGFKIAKGEFIIVLNPDIEFTKNTDINKLILYYKKHKWTGIIAPRLYYSNGAIQENARSFPKILTLLIRGFGVEKFFSKYDFYKKELNFSKSETELEVDWVIGAFMVIKKELLEKLNYFDPKFFMYYEDADLCFRAHKMGYKTIYFPYVSAIHIYKRESAKKIISKLKLIHIHSIIRFYLKYFK